MSASRRARGEVSRPLVLRSLSSRALAERISLAEKVLEEWAVHDGAAAVLIIVARIKIHVAVGEVRLRLRLLLTRGHLICSCFLLLVSIILEEAEVTSRRLLLLLL